MKTRFLSISLAIASAFSGASAFAASVDVAVPFEFSAGGKMLPAGKYSMSVESPNILMIRGAMPDTSITVMVTPDLATTVNAAVTFTEGPEKNSLAKVNLGTGMSYILSAPKHSSVASLGAKGDVLLSRH